MGYPGDAMATTLNAEKLEKLLRHAKVAQQSIQSVANWILDRRAFLNEVVDIWVRLMKEGDAHHQIVYLYIANETMQVGVRKYGKHIAEMFEAKMLDIVEYVMKDGEEKVKRCVIKIIGIWKERKTVTPALLEMLQNVCAGKPAVPEAPVKEELGVEEQARVQREAFVKELGTDVAVNVALADMTELHESEATRVMSQRLQDLVSATISADLLSDRMFQLESSLTTFHHAIEAFGDADAAAESKKEDEDEEKSAGDIVWSMLDQQVFDVDVDRSREHVQQYRENLEAQNAKRDELISHLESLVLLDPFQEPIFHTSRLLRDEQTEALERLYDVSLKADIMEKERQAERQAAYHSRPPLMPPMGTGVSPRDSVDAFRGSQQYNYHPSYSSNDSFQRPPAHRRFTSMDTRDFRHNEDDRYGGGDEYYSKRPRLQHSQSLPEDSRRHRPSRWGDSPRGDRQMPSYDRGQGGGGGYGYEDRYQDRRDPSPRHGYNGHQGGGRWDSYPQDDSRRDYQRRW